MRERRAKDRVKIIEVARLLSKVRFGIGVRARGDCLSWSSSWSSSRGRGKRSRGWGWLAMTKVKVEVKVKVKVQVEVEIEIETELWVKCCRSCVSFEVCVEVNYNVAVLVVDDQVSMSGVATVAGL